MAKNIYSANKAISRRSSHSRRHSKKKKHIFRSIIGGIKKDPIKIIAVVFGGILLILITILFLLYAKESTLKKNQFQKIESR